MLQLYTKTGVRIIGTLETIPGTALVQGFQRYRGELVAIYAGDTDVCWDGQETVVRNGQTIYVGEDGDEYTLAQLEVRGDGEAVVAAQPGDDNAVDDG